MIKYNYINSQLEAIVIACRVAQLHKEWKNQELELETLQRRAEGLLNELEKQAQTIDSKQLETFANNIDWKNCRTFLYKLKHNQFTNNEKKQN
jgi:hypothetical protein